MRVLLLSCLIATTCLAEALTVRDVVNNAVQNHPDIRSQRSLIRMYESEQLSKLGKWDAYLESSANIATHKTYSGDYIDTKVVQPIPFAQMKAYGGYRISGGKFPSYEGGLETLDLGEVYGGVQWSVLESFSVDADRLELFKTNLKIAQQEAKATLTTLKVQSYAIKAYYEWLAAEAARRIYVDQYQLAKVRTEMIARQIREGNFAEIYATENEQYLLQRQNELALATMAVTTASNSLGLFMTAAGQAVQPLELLAPVELLENVAAIQTTAWNDADQVLPPSIRLAKMELSFIEQQVAFQKMQRLPKLIVDAKIKRDFGNGPAELANPDFDVSTLLQYPLQNRQARGAADAIEWRVRMLEQSILSQTNEWNVTLKNMREQLSANAIVAKNTAQESVLAMKLAAAERARWRQGDSTLLAVNIREQNTAKAKIRHVKALLDQHKLWAEYLNNTSTILSTQ